MTKISVFFQAKSNQQTTKAANNNSEKPNLKQKPDMVDISTKPKMSKGKKALLITAGVVGAAAVTMGAIALIYKGHIKNIQKQASKIQENAQKVINDIMQKFDNGEGVKILDDGTKVIEELADDGQTILRKSTLNPTFRLLIDDFANKTRTEAHYGSLSGFYKKVDLSEDKFKAKEIFGYFAGEFNVWTKNYQKNPDGSWSYGKEIWFKDGKISNLKKNWLGKPDKTLSCDKRIFFKDGKLSGWEKNWQERPDKSVSYDKAIEFKDGKLFLVKNGKMDEFGNLVFGEEKEIDLNLIRALKNLFKK